MSKMAIITVKILLSVTAIQYGAIPPIMDLSESHVYHSDWPPHARFHMVWLLGVGSALALCSLGLIWTSATNETLRLKLAIIPGVIVLSGFFFATFSSNFYGGSLSDLQHKVEFFGLDGNLVSFSIAVLFQLVAILIVWKTNSAVS